MRNLRNNLRNLREKYLKLIFKPLNNIGGFFMKGVFLRGFEKNLPQRHKGYYPVSFCFVIFAALWEIKS